MRILSVHRRRMSANADSFTKGNRAGVLVEPLETRSLLSGSLLPAPDISSDGPPRGGVITGFYNGDAQLEALALQGDGKIVAAGYATEGGARDFALARYNLDGSLDPTFGSGGIVLTNMSYRPDAAAVAIDAQGRIVIAGSTAVQTGPNSWVGYWAVLRYNANGSLDTNFGTGGAAQSVSSVIGTASAIALTTDGKIDVAGSGTLPHSSSSPALVAQLNTDGSLNTAFGNQGFTSNNFLSPQSIALQSDGRLVIGGFASGVDGFKFGLERLNADGSLDSTFGTSGHTVTSLKPGYDWLHTITLGPGGTILAAGSVQEGINADDDAIARYLSDGMLDPTFGAGGFETFDINAYDGISSVQVTSGGEIITAGSSMVNGLTAFTVAELRWHGSFDSSFGKNGYTQTVVGQGYSDVNAAALTSTGGIIVGGSFDSTGQSADHHWALALYTAEGTPDQTFGVPYDINSDGSVDAADLAILQQNLNQPGTFATGDLNGDGIVDQTDYNILVQNFSGGEISGSVLRNADSTFNASTSFPGVTVYLDANNNGQLDPGEYSTTTDVNGAFQFLNLTAGTYTVRQVLPSGYAQTSPVQYSVSVAVPAGEWAAGPTFADVQVSTIPMNAAYLATLRSWLGQPGSFADGDVNGDGIVDSQDLLIVQENYGHAIGALINGTVNDDAVSLVQDADHQHIDWTMGGNAGQMGLSDANGMTINGNGGTDTILLDYANGNPLPAALHLNGTFTINGLQGTNPFSGTTLDIGRSTVFITYANAASDPIAAIQSDLQAAYNGGAWNGTPTAFTGIVTSAAAAANHTAGLNTTGIGYADSADGQGVNIVPNTIELKYTLDGDANLDGQVNSADLQILPFNLNRPGAWDEGDFNYDGQVNSADLQSLLFAFNTSLGNQATPLAVAATPTASTTTNAPSSSSNPSQHLLPAINATGSTTTPSHHDVRPAKVAARKRR